MISRHSFDSGFPLGDQIIPWGTTPGGFLQRREVTDADFEFSAEKPIQIPLNRTLGLPALFLEIESEPGDRPILQVRYEMRAEGRGLVNTLTECFGKPSSESIDPEAHGSEGRVAHHARWECEEVGIGVSVYGALRPFALGESTASLWISWRDVEKAAAPFLAERLDAEAELAAISPGLEMIGRFLPDERPRSIGASSGQDMRARKAYLCLQKSPLLETPEALKSQLGDRHIAVWRDKATGRIGISTAHDTQIFPAGKRVPVIWIELLAAKGGGYSGIQMGEFLFRNRSGSPAVAEFAALLAAVPEIDLRREDGYDC